MGDSFPITERNRVRRRSQRGRYDHETVYSILDEGLICHVAFQVNGQPFAVPTIHARIDDDLYFHGSTANRMLGALSRGALACLTVTLIDGLVLARSAFHHSMNYRSVTVFGRGHVVEDPSEKRDAFEALVERMMPGRWSDTRHPSRAEFEATTVLRLPIDEASAKVRTGDPVDDEADHALPHWAGVVPLSLRRGTACPAADLRDDIELPAYLKDPP